jgi:hypothetical protein
MIKPLEFFICDETDNSGFSVMPWSEKEEKRKYGSCNVYHVIEKYEYDRLKSENARLREALEFYADDESGTDDCSVAREALKGGE